MPEQQLDAVRKIFVRFVWQQAHFCAIKNEGLNFIFTTSFRRTSEWRYNSNHSALHSLVFSITPPATLFLEKEQTVPTRHIASWVPEPACLGAVTNMKYLILLGFELLSPRP